MYELYYEARIHEHQVCNKKKVKVKFTLKQATRGQMENRCIALLFL